MDAGALGPSVAEATPFDAHLHGRMNADGRRGGPLPPLPAPYRPCPTLTTLRYDGAAYCWGIPWEEWLTPQPVPGGGTFNSLSVGLKHACGVPPDGRPRCWGFGRGIGVWKPENDPWQLLPIAGPLVP